MQVVRTDGVEPSLRVYQTRVLTIVLRPSGDPGNRTPLGQFAKLACHLNDPQKPSRIRTEPAALQAASSPRGSGPRGWLPENRTLLAEARGLQPPLSPRTQPAEGGGVEPLAFQPAPVSSGGPPHGGHLPEESRGIEPPGCHTWHGFLDRLPTIGRYLPELPTKDSNPD